MAQIIEQALTDSGERFRKESTPSGVRHRGPNGQYVSEETYANALQQTDGVEVPTPDGPAVVSQDKASIFGRSANFDKIDRLSGDDSIPFGKDEYTAEEIKEAYDERSDQMPDEDVVRYRQA